MQSHLAYATHFYTGKRGGGAYSTPFSVMKMEKYIIHSKSAILRWIYALAYYFLFIIRCWSMGCVQSASQAVSGSDQVVWPSGEPRGRQWPHCVAEVPLVSMTLPATETGRSKMAERYERALLVLVMVYTGQFLILFGGSFSSGGLVSEL